MEKQYFCKDGTEKKQVKITLIDRDGKERDVGTRTTCRCVGSAVQFTPPEKTGKAYGIYGETSYEEKTLRKTTGGFIGVLEGSGSTILLTLIALILGIFIGYKK